MAATTTTTTTHPEPMRLQCGRCNVRYVLVSEALAHPKGSAPFIAEHHRVCKNPIAA